MPPGSLVRVSVFRQRSRSKYRSDTLALNSLVNRNVATSSNATNTSSEHRHPSSFNFLNTVDFPLSLVVQRSIFSSTVISASSPKHFHPPQGYTPEEFLLLSPFFQDRDGSMAKDTDTSSGTKASPRIIKVTDEAY